jgi:zinc D-Ala-D-Ala carboxypeptidase
MFKYFTLDELKCKCGECNSTGAEMDIEFMRTLDTIREACGFPLFLSSAYRCPTYNQKVSSTGLAGPHTTGMAVDVLVRGEKAIVFLGKCIEAKITGYGIQQKGSGRFIHIDILTAPEFPRPTIYSY